MGGIHERRGQPEVGNPEVPVLAEQEVGRLDVTVDDSLGVGVVEGPAGLKEDGQDL